MLTREDLAAIEHIFEEKIDKKLTPVHKKLNKLQKDLNMVIGVFDSDIVDLQKRMDKVETAVFL